MGNIYGYGPSAATGIVGLGTYSSMTGSAVMWAVLAIFTLLSAFGALLRILPKFHCKK